MVYKADGERCRSVWKKPWQPTPLHDVCSSYEFAPPPPQRPLDGDMPHPHKAVGCPIHAVHTLWAWVPTNTGGQMA